MSLVNEKGGGVAVVNDATIIQGKAECGQLERCWWIATYNVPLFFYKYLWILSNPPFMTGITESKPVCVSIQTVRVLLQTRCV